MHETATSLGGRWLSVEEVATYLGVSRDTVYRWIESRAFPAHKVGRSWKSKVAEIDEWVKSGRGAERFRRNGTHTAGYATEWPQVSIDMTKQKQQELDSGNNRVLAGLSGQIPYSARLSARSALYTDLHLLLNKSDEALSRGQYQKLIIEENCLSRSSVSSRRKVWDELRKRYILDRDQPLFLAFWREWQSCRSDFERGLTAYTLLALNDRLVADLGIDWLYNYLRTAPAELSVNEVLNFLRRAAQSQHPEVKAWTEDTQLHVAQHYTASIRDFGLARGKLRKTSVRPGLHGAPMRLLIRALRLAGNKDLEIVTAPIFRLLALDGHEVIDALGELNRRGDLRFRMQADVVELDVEEKG